MAGTGDMLGDSTGVISGILRYAEGWIETVEWMNWLEYNKNEPFLDLGKSPYIYRES